MDNATHVELRCPDPTCNPYMAITAILAAGMDGIDSKLIAPNPLNNINIYHLTEKERARMKIASLPSSLGEALNELDKDTVLKTALGEYLYEAFTREKWAEWDDYRMHITDWEVEHYLEVS
jgi:glutamine synthetase